VQTQRRDLYGKYAELLIEKGGAYDLQPHLRYDAGAVRRFRDQRV